jgi:hypothetical protein
MIRVAVMSRFSHRKEAKHFSLSCRLERTSRAFVTKPVIDISILYEAKWRHLGHIAKKELS